MLMCLQIDWIIRQRHVHRKGIPTSMLSYVYTSQSLARYNSHWTQSGRVYKTGTVAVDGPTERYARGPCNRLRKFCFCVTAAARPLCLPWTIKAAVVAQQVAQKRQSEGRTIAMVPQVLSWSLNGGTVVATVIAQWTPWVGQKRHNGGTRKADVSLKLMFAFFTGRQMADHCASILRPRWCVCLHPAFFERPVSDRPPRRPLCDCFEHAQNFTASMAMSERPMCHPWTTKATVRPPFCLQWRPGQFCGRTREAQRSQPLCKGGINVQRYG